MLTNVTLYKISSSNKHFLLYKFYCNTQNKKDMALQNLPLRMDHPVPPAAGLEAARWSEEGFEVAGSAAVGQNRGPG